MTRTVIGGAVLAVLAGLLAIGGDAFGITTVWPVLLAAAVGLVAGRATVGRTGGFVLGAVLGFVGMALQAGVLPDAASSRAIVVVLAVVVLTAVAAVTRGGVPLWAGLAGYATYVAFYSPMFASDPTAFLSQAPAALATVILATALGTLVAVLAELGAERVPAESPAAVPAAEVAR